MATLAGVHQAGIPGIEDYRPIGIRKAGESKPEESAPKPAATPAPAQDKVEISKESQEPKKESGSFLENIMKTLNPFD